MYNTLNNYLIEQFGEKVYKLSLDAGFSCPHRDSDKNGGCIFCSSGGSGDFCPSSALSINQQIEEAKLRLKNKKTGTKYIAYFQAYTNTYGPIKKLSAVFYEAIERPDIVSMSIATRPDCLGGEVLDLLEKLNKIKPVFVELGLQSSNEATARLINRGYENKVFESAVKNLKKIGINIVAHIILGLPGEGKTEMLGTIKYISDLGVDGVKLQLLHVLKNTRLAEMHSQSQLYTMTMEEYIKVLSECVQRLAPEIIIHRISGDGAKKDLIAPLWSANKKRVLNSITKYFNEHNIIQGSGYTPARLKNSSSDKIVIPSF